MFDIGFTEIIVIAGVTLVVVGPERLPETVRTVGLWLGRFKRSLRETRRELENQFGADDIRRQLHNEEIMRSLESVRDDTVDAFDLQQDLEKEDDLYPPGHHDHDPNNDEEEKRLAAENTIAPPQNSDVQDNVVQDSVENPSDSASVSGESTTETNKPS
ncbi:Sec-independent protein translocase protein TatB [Aurantivibrio plasticivorans]